MSLKQDFTAILDKEMDRKDFIKHLGIGLLALTGLSSVLQTLAPVRERKSSGYGGSSYGGHKNA